MQEVECRIYGQSVTGQNIELKQTTRVPPGDTQMVRFSIGELGNGNYRFEAKGLTPIAFTVRRFTTEIYTALSFNILSGVDPARVLPQGILSFHPD